MQLRALLAERPPFRKFLVLVGLLLVCSVIFTIIGGLVAQMIYHIPVMSDPGALNNLKNDAVVQSYKMMQLFAAIGTFIIPAILAAYVFSNQPAKFLGVDKQPRYTSVILTVILMCVCVPLINWLTVQNSHLQLPESMQSIQNWIKEKEDMAMALTEAFINVHTTSGLIYNLFLIALLPAVGEELLFRGTVLPLFKQMTKNVHVSVFLTAVVFSALHMQFFGFVPRVALGMLLGYLYVWSGSLWLAVLAHFVNNAGAVILAYIEAKQGLPFDQDTVGAGAGDGTLLLMSLVLTVVILMAIRKVTRPMPIQI